MRLFLGRARRSCTADSIPWGVGFDALAKELKADGHAVTALDLPGHGDRSHESAKIDGYRNAVHEVFDEGDILVGHSMGGVLLYRQPPTPSGPDRATSSTWWPFPVEGQPMGMTQSVDVTGTSLHYVLREPTGKAVWPSDRVPLLQRRPRALPPRLRRDGRSPSLRNGNGLPR